MYSLNTTCNTYWHRQCIHNVYGIMLLGFFFRGNILHIELTDFTWCKWHDEKCKSQNRHPRVVCRTEVVGPAIVLCVVGFVTQGFVVAGGIDLGLGISLWMGLIHVETITGGVRVFLLPTESTVVILDARTTCSRTQHVHLRTKSYYCRLKHKKN